MSAAKPDREIKPLLIAGGRPMNPELMADMMSRAFGDIQKPRVAYIGTANGDNPEFFRMMETILKNSGADEVVFVRLACDRPDLENAKKILADADVVFLSGGEVEDGMNWLNKHNLAGFLKDLYHGGKRFMGLSAGVIMMGSHWVHWDVEGDDDTSSLFDCLGFIPCLFDVHGEYENWIELKAALKLLGGGALGYALPSGCVISGGSDGALVNLEKEYIVFANSGGMVKTVKRER